MSSKTLYATAEAEDLTDDGHGRIRILTEFNEPDTEIDVVEYPADEDYDRATANIYAALIDAGYQRVGSTSNDGDGLIVPVERADRQDKEGN